MSAVDTEHFRERLLEERKRASDALEYLQQENQGQLEDEREEIQSDNHPGDMATIFGFGASGTRALTALDGVAGFTGVTIHAETAGEGTGVNASMTFAGIDLATAQQRFAFSQGTLPGDIGYLLVQYV